MDHFFVFSWQRKRYLLVEQYYVWFPDFIVGYTDHL